MENAARKSHLSKRFLNSLAPCIERDAPITALEKQAWKDTKYQGSSLFLLGRGASYKVFNAGPLRPEILTYCVQDVLFSAAFTDPILRSTRPRMETEGEGAIE